MVNIPVVFQQVYSEQKDMKNRTIYCYPDYSGISEEDWDKI